MPTAASSPTYSNWPRRFACTGPPRVDDPAGPSLPDKIVALHRALEAANVDHAFGGALALAWCTNRPRGTSDVDINVFAPPSQTRKVLRALPGDVALGRRRPRAVAP